MNRIVRSKDASLGTRRIRVGTPDAGTEAEPSDELPEQLKEELFAEWKKKHEEEISRARKEAHREGYAEGHQDAEETLREAFQQERRDWQDGLSLIQDVWTNLTDQLEREIPPRLVSIASKVLGQELPRAFKQQVGPAVAEAIDELAGGGPVVVSLHPVDHLLLQESGLKGQIEGATPEVTWKPDPDLSEGDWSISSKEAVLRRFKKEIIGRLQEAVRQAVNTSSD